MNIQSTNVTCEKCGTVMERVVRQSPRSFGMFSGFTDVTSTSVATSVTIIPPSTHSPDESFQQPTRIRIVKYICPSCGWECQKRE